MKFSKVSLSFSFINTIVKLSFLLSNSAGYIKSAIFAKYEIDDYWPHKSISKLNIFGSGIAVDHSNGNIIVLHRSNKNDRKEKELILESTILVISKSSGKVIGEWGSNLFAKPHGISTTKDGHIFITDVVLHQVFKFDYSNASSLLWSETPSIELGERFIQGRDENHFCGPADVAVSETGEFYVADGYCNSRVVKFCKHGHFQMEFESGSTSFGGPALPFNVTHSIALAKRQMPTTSSDLNMLIFVADRNNARIQCFSTNGSFVYEINHESLGIQKSMIFSLVTVPNNNFSFGKMFVINGHVSNNPPRVFEMGLNEFSFQLLSSFLNAPQQSTIDKQFNTGNGHPHDIAVDVKSKGQYIYIVDAVLNLTLKRFYLTKELTSHANHLNVYTLLIIIITIVHLL